MKNPAELVELAANRVDSALSDLIAVRRDVENGLIDATVKLRDDLRAYAARLRRRGPRES